MVPKSFHSNGKLMITGEYLVLVGAPALAVPLRYGQGLEVSYSGSGDFLYWETCAKNETWLKAVFDTKTLELIDASDAQKATFLQKLLKATKVLSPDFLATGQEIKAKSKVEFNMEFGFGSSSSLIANVAKWAEIDPLNLFFRLSNGSGYDVACAISEQPIIYRLKDNRPGWKQATFDPLFSDKLFFVYRGKKKRSEEAVIQFGKEKNDFRQESERIATITEKLMVAEKLEEFEDLLEEHEQIIASVIKQKPVKQVLFTDLQGAAKSLGAWGGDFVMISWRESRKELQEYLTKKGLTTFFAFNELIKSGAK